MPRSNESCPNAIRAPNTEPGTRVLWSICYARSLDSWRGQRRSIDFPNGPPKTRMTRTSAAPKATIWRSAHPQAAPIHKNRKMEKGVTRAHGNQLFEAIERNERRAPGFAHQHRENRLGRGARRGARLGPGIGSRERRPVVRVLLHDQAWRLGNGAVDLPFNH